MVRRLGCPNEERRMASPLVEVYCFHCSAKVSPREATNGWCDSCGKRLPSWVQVEAKRYQSIGTLPHIGGLSPARSRGRRLLWGSIFLILLAAVVLVVLAFRGTIAWNFFG